MDVKIFASKINPIHFPIDELSEMQSATMLTVNLSVFPSIFVAMIIFSGLYLVDSSTLSVSDFLPSYTDNRWHQM